MIVINNKQIMIQGYDLINHVTNNYCEIRYDNKIVIFKGNDIKVISLDQEQLIIRVELESINIK